MASLNQLLDIFPILSEDGNFVVDDPSVTAYGNFLAGVARIVDGFFKLPFNATGTALQLCGEIVPVNASLRPKHFLNHVAGLFVQLVVAKIGLTYGLNTVSGCVLLPPDQTVTNFFLGDRESTGIEECTLSKSIFECISVLTQPVFAF